MTTLPRQIRLTLSALEAPRVLTRAGLVEIVATANPRLDDATIGRMLVILEERHLVKRITEDLFLNGCAKPGVTRAEAAQVIHKEAIVSIHTVLGDMGVLNNYTHNVNCVVPADDRDVGMVATTVDRTDGYTFTFQPIPRKRLLAPERHDLLQPAAYPMASAEAAICHWLYLANCRFAEFGGLPNELDLEVVDLDKISRIGTAMGIEKAVEKWRKTVDLHYEQGFSEGLGL